MKITRIYLKNFKRFTELEIKEIPVEAKLVVLSGPNGCGKSSIFDAFEQILNIKMMHGFAKLRPTKVFLVTEKRFRRKRMLSI